MKKIKKEIDYYGSEADYIHLKFGDCRKMYNFTPDFIAKYPQFAKAFQMYWNGELKRYYSFENPFQVVSYAFNHKIPVHFYYNYTDTPAKSRKEIIAYLLNENNINKLLEDK